MAKERRHRHMPRPDESNREEQQVVAGKRRRKEAEKTHRHMPRPYEANKEELAEVGNRRKKEKKRKPRRDEVEGEQAEIGKMGRNKEKKRKPKHDDEVGKREGVTVDAASASGKRRKVVRWRLRQKLLRCLRGREVMGHFAAGTPPIDPEIPQLFFDQQLREEIIAEFEENKEFDSYLLFQYRTKGYAEIQEEVSDDEGEGYDYEIRYFVSEDES